MSHRRTEIRTALVDLLKGNTAAGASVFPSRVEPLWDAPALLLLVYSRPEQCSAISSYPGPMERKLQMTIEIRATGSDGEAIETTLDDVAKQIEGIIAANPKLKNTVLSTNLQGTEPDAVLNGEEIVGAARITYEVIYEG